MRISDWSSDVCSSDLDHDRQHGYARRAVVGLAGNRQTPEMRWRPQEQNQCEQPRQRAERRVGHGGTRQHRKAAGQPTDDDIDRKSVVSGKSSSGRVDLGGRRLIKKKIKSITKE